MAAIPELRVEVAFQNEPTFTSLFGGDGNPTWTDISDRVRLPKGMTVRRGRQYELDQIQPGTASYVVVNDDGAFTPGKPTSPYAPFVIPGRRTRGTAVWQGISYPLFDCYVDSWGSGWPTRYAARNLCQVTCTDRLKQLSRHTFSSALVEETTHNGSEVIGYWPLAEPVDARARFGDNELGFRPSSGQQPDLLLVSVKPAGEISAEALPIVGAEGETAVRIKQTAFDSGTYLHTTIDTSRITDDWSVSLWINGYDGRIVNATFADIFNLPDGATAFGAATITLNPASAMPSPGAVFHFFLNGGGLDSGNYRVDDGRPHHIVVTTEINVGNDVITLYVDGEQRDQLSTALSVPIPAGELNLMASTDQLGVTQFFYGGMLGHVVLFKGALNFSQVRDIYKRGADGLVFNPQFPDQDNTSARAQYLINRYVDDLFVTVEVDQIVPPSDAGRISVGHQNLSGRSATDLLTELGTAAGGINFIGPDGTLRTYSADRRRRVVPAFTLDAAAGEASGLDFSADDQLLVNDLQFMGASGAQGRATNEASITRFGRFRGQLDLPLTTPDEARARAQRQVRDFGSPRPRTQSIEIDLVANPHLFPALLAADLFDRFDTTGLPGNAPAPVMPWLVEQIEHRVTEKSWVAAIQASPYDVELQPEDLMQVFTSSGTYNKPAGLVAVRVRVKGGGGGSGGTAATSVSQAAQGAGGGEGGYSEKVIMAASIGATETVTIGAGGTAATAGANPGGSGGTTSFGTHCSATGGSGGAGGTATTADAASVAGAGGVGSGGDLNLSGQRGGFSLVREAEVYGNNYGGGSTLAAAQSGTLLNADGAAGNNYGGGAAGANSGPAQVARPGGAGVPGVVIVENNFGSGFE